MAKVLRCGELFPGCAVEARGETDDDILQQAAVSVLSQANTQPQLALSLLGNR